MISEMIIGGLVFYVIFGGYINAHAKRIREEARKMRLENDIAEFGEETEDLDE